MYHGLHPYPLTPTMSNSLATYELAETEYVSVNGSRIAYRRLGRQNGVPLLHLLHFG